MSEKLIKEEALRTAQTYLQTLCASNYYGGVMFKFEAGHIVAIKPEPIVKMHELAASMGIVVQTMVAGDAD